MFLLAFVEALPLLVNEQVFAGVQVRAGLSFRVPPKMGETWLLSCAPWTIYIFSDFRVLWEQNLECSDPSARGIGSRNAGMLFVLVDN